MSTIKKNLFYYFKILRLSHWFKNLVVLFGTIAAIAYLEVNPPILTLIGKFCLAFLLACLVSSVNYIVNGITDKTTDSYHPVKNQRVILYKKISKRSLFTVATILLLSSLFIAIVIYGFGMFISLLSLFIAGIFYNIKPLRFKDLPFIDVISESVNNPIRILIGWFAISESLTFPPLSFLLLFWASGAVLMSAKRYAELKFLLESHPKTIPSLYRNSYRYYSLPNIFLMVLFYLAATIILFIYFSLEFKTKLLFSLPVIFGFFIWFLIIMKEKNSAFREPESVFAKKPLFSLTALTILLILLFLALLG